MPPSPYRLFDLFNSAYRTAALRAAIELDLFSAIAAGSTTTAQIAAGLQASERGVRILCDTCVAMGLLNSSGGAYGLPEDVAAFLDRRSPYYLGALARMSMQPGAWPHLNSPERAVIAGASVMGPDADIENEQPEWPEFARAIAPMMALPAAAMADLVHARGCRGNRILEVAAGHALFGIAVAKHNPEARLTALDWPAVLDVAREKAAAAGIALRFVAIAGNVFAAEFGGRYELAVIANFLHMLDPEKAVELLAKVHGALVPGGAVAIFDFVVDEDRTSPAVAAIFAMTMLTATRGGDAYTFAEASAMCRRAGFARAEMHELPPFDQRVVLAYANS
jgi:ubiquinone/menaquinone biosynthesis C-methylase UbiE